MARTETEAKAIVFIVLARRRQTTSAMKKQTNTKPRRSNSVFQLLVHAFSIGSTFLLLPNRGGVGGGVSAWVATKTSPPTTETVSCCWRWRRSFHFHHTRTVRPTTTTTALAQSSFTPSTGSSPEISVGVVGSSSSLSNSNKAMEFLKKIGKVGGAANRDFRLAIGFDEGSSEKATSSLTMSLAARGGGTVRASWLVGWL